MDSIVWAIKHTMRDIAETGLNRTCSYSLDLRVPWLTPVTVSLEIINNFASADAQIANQFFQQYYLSILQDTFFVLTDADHKSGFKLQSLLLARMVQLVATDTIHAPLFDPAVVNDSNMTNAKFVRDYTANLLKSAFPHAARYAFCFSTCSGHSNPFATVSSDIMVFVLNLAEYHSDVNRFKLALRDFLIQLKEFSDDNAELFVDEKEAEAARKAQQEREAALRIPGMLKPSQLEDKDEDI
jgi:exportin-1